MFDKIITITLNPAFDVTNWCDTCSFKEPNIVTKDTITASGKGVNVSKVLLSLGVKNSTVFILGEDNKDKFTKLLDYEDVKYYFSTVKGAIRENITLCFPNDTVMKVNRQGPNITSSAVNEVVDIIKGLYSEDETVLLVFSGSIPTNMDKKAYRNFIKKFKTPNLRIAIDNSSLTLEDYMAIKPFIIKPNYQEMQTIMGNSIKNENALIKCIETISEYVTHTMVSLGEKGVIYGSKDVTYKAVSEKIQAISTIGAGDTLLAGFIYGLYNDKDIKECIKWAAACGSASVLLEGTKTITLSNTLNMLDNITLN